MTAAGLTIGSTRLHSIRQCPAPSTRIDSNSSLGKFGLRDRVHAVVFAYKSGQVRPGA